jgi:hypothetical protein
MFQYLFIINLKHRDKNSEMEDWRSKYYRTTDQLAETEKKLALLQRERDNLSGYLRDK